MEEMRYDKGRIANPSLLDYKVLSPFETPDMNVVIVESDDKEGPFGAKEAGEGPLLPVLPAVGNAVFDAVGFRAHSLPIRPEQVFQHLQKVRKSPGGLVKTWEK
jgi:CO/xanthine dehydrogenase Mo-binding subunit